MIYLLSIFVLKSRTSCNKQTLSDGLSQICTVKYMFQRILFLYVCYNEDFVFRIHSESNVQSRYLRKQSCPETVDSVGHCFNQASKLFEICQSPFLQVSFQNDALSQVMLWPYLPRGYTEMQRNSRGPRNGSSVPSHSGGLAASSFCGFNLWSDFNA